jgi:hypothetical protein
MKDRQKLSLVGEQHTKSAVVCFSLQVEVAKGLARCTQGSIGTKLQRDKKSGRERPLWEIISLHTSGEDYSILYRTALSLHSYRMPYRIRHHGSGPTSCGYRE